MLEEQEMLEEQSTDEKATHNGSKLVITWAEIFDWNRLEEGLPEGFLDAGEGPP